MPDDVIEQLTKQVKKLQKEIDELRAAGADDSRIKALEEKNAALEAKLAARTDFGEWD